MSKLENDNIYYNFEIRNDPNVNDYGILCKKEIDLNQSLLSNPQDYYFTITRFSLSGKSIPLILIPIVEGVLQSNPNLTPWTVSLVWNNNVFTQNVIFSPENLNFTVLPPSQNNGVQDLSNDYYFIYSYDSLCNYFNTALLNAYNALKTAFPMAPISQPPFFTFNPNNSLFKLYFDIQLSLAPIPVSIHMNNLGYLMFDNFQSNFFVNNPNLNLSYQFITKILPNNLNYVYVNGVFTNTAYIEQNYSNMSYINSVKSIIFISNSLGTAKEITPSRSLNSSGILNGVPILTDFNVPNEKAGSLRERIEYSVNGLGNYRLVNINSTNDIKKIDVQAFWMDNLGRIFPVYLYRNTFFSMKMLFINKKLFLKY